MVTVPFSAGAQNFAAVHHDGTIVKFINLLQGCANQHQQIQFRTGLHNRLHGLLHAIQQLLMQK